MTHNLQFSPGYFSPGPTPASVVTACSLGSLKIYDGIQPAGPGTAISGQHVLATLAIPSFATPVISGGQYSAVSGTISPVKASATGQASWFRIFSASGVAVLDGAIGTADSDMVLSPAVSINAGVKVTISKLTVSGSAGQDVTGTVSVVVPAPGTPATVPSGYAGTEPAYTGALEWPAGSGIHWELEGWGSGSGWPAAGNVSIDPATGYLNLRTTWDGTQLLGAEVDSVRGDLGLPGNPSRWGYGRYRWVIGTDLSTIDPTLVLGLFTFWAYGSPTTTPANQYGKGGPPGQKEIDIEFSNWSPEGDRTPDIFAMMGFYQDTGGGATQGQPPTYGQVTHTLTNGSQLLVPAGHPVSTYEFTWMPDHITWNLWYSDITGLATPPPPDYTLTMTEGQQYSYTEPFGGGVFTGTVHIPPTGGQQVIMNLWSQGQNVAVPNTTVVLRSFSYKASDA